MCCTSELKSHIVSFAMKTIMFFFNLFICISFFCFVIGCQANIKIDDDQEMALDPAYEDLLSSISRFEQDNDFAVDPPTRRINWGFILAADATPVVIGSAFGGVGLFGGACFGILSSFFVATLDRSLEKEQSGMDWTKEAEVFNNIQIDDAAEAVGVIHNAVLQQLIQESVTVDYSKYSDWELFSIIEQKVADYFPDGSAIVSKSQFQTIKESFPDPRNYSDLDSFEGACLSDYPSLMEDFTVAFRVLSTIVAQQTDDQLDHYENGVIQLIRDSSISEESKKGLIGTVSVQKASKEFWYE